MENVNFHKNKIFNSFKGITLRKKMGKQDFCLNPFLFMFFPGSLVL